MSHQELHLAVAAWWFGASPVDGAGMQCHLEGMAAMQVKRQFGATEAQQRVCGACCTCTASPDACKVAPMVTP